MGISQQTQDLIIADPNVALGFLNCVGYLVTVCWVLGYPDSARGYADRLAQLLKQSLPVNAHAIGTHHLLTMRCDFLREYDGARVQAQEAVDRSSQSGFGWGIAFGTIGLGRIMVAEGDASDGIKKLEGIDASQAAIDKHWASCLAARAYLSAHRATEGSTIVQEAITAIAAGGSRLFEAELHRMMGEFILMDGEALGEAEAAFNSAISIARRQQAKSFQLRATMSLARLLAKRGKTRKLVRCSSRSTTGSPRASIPPI